jgi:Tat protein secretion system quality control protein TatD with DNase activity
VQVAKTLAEVKGLSLAEIAEATRRNSDTLFATR